MKKLILILIPLFIFLCACSKDDDSSIDQSLDKIAMKVDGQNFSSDFTSSKIDNGIFSIIGIEKPDEPDPLTILLAFIAPNNEDIEEGIYQSSDLSCLNEEDACGYIDYGLTDPNLGLEYGSGEDNGSSTIEISSIEYEPGGHVRGTFFGKLLNISGDEVDITEGEFSMTIEE